MILRPIGPLFRRDDVGQGGDADGDAAFVSVRRGASIERVVAEPDASSVGHVVEDVERSGIGHPGRDLSAPEELGRWQVAGDLMLSASASPSTRSRALSSRIAAASRVRFSRSNRARQSRSPVGRVAPYWRASPPTSR
jgi:hypothetical protein